MLYNTLMGNVTVIRHSKANYPKDELTLEGVEFAGRNKERFGGYSRVVCSPLVRSQQTANALGYSNPIVDERLREFEIEINTVSADAYIKEVHLRFATELYRYGDKLLEAIKYYGEEDCLLVSHNAIMSACLYLLIGDNNSFDNLSGFKVQVKGIDVFDLQRISLK